MANYSPENIMLLKRAQFLAIFIAITICLIKLYSWIATDSSALFASLTDALMDLTSSAINIIALKLAMAPPDHNHRFGHNKIEDLAVFGQSIFITLSGLFAFYTASKNLVYRQEIEDVNTGIYGVVVCSILTLGLVYYQALVIKKTHSNIIKADKLHYLSDLLANMAVIVSLYLGNHIYYIDSVFGMIIACYVIFVRCAVLLLKLCFDSENLDGNNP